MSLNSALDVARSGLQANQIWSDVTARNIANANTDGYVRKDVTFSTRAPGSGGGTIVTEVKREVDATLDRMYRTEAGKMAKQQQIYEGVQAYTAILGQPDDNQSPVSKLTALQTSFETLANAPGSAAAQRGVLDAANQMASSLNEASNMLGQVGHEVTTEIKYNVTDVNKALYNLVNLNNQLLNGAVTSIPRTDLLDQVDQQIKAISGIMDVQVKTDPTGAVSLYTSGGTPLLDGNKVSDVSYDVSTGKLFAGQTEVTPGASGVRGFDGGSLAGLFALKDQILPTFQNQLDTMAAGLVQGFEGADASLTAGQAGLFTDAGAAYNAANLAGLAGRIAVNAAVDPAQGGTLSRIRDGVGAATPGATSDATQVLAFEQVFQNAVPVTAATDLPAGLKLSDYASNMVSYQQVTGTTAQSQYTSIATSAQTIDASRQSIQGVNIDDEMQKLIVIQHSYAANSKMMTTIAQMMDDLIQAV